MKALLAALVVALLAMLVIGRDRDPSPDAPRGAGLFGGSGCTVEAVAPHRDVRNNRIVGTARHRCSGADLDFTVHLQRRDPNGSWASIEERQVVVRGSRRPRTVTTVGGCVEGVYRTFLRGTATIGGHTRPFEDDSPTVTNPCPNSRAR